MHKAVTVIWDAASSLASDEIDRIRKEAGEGIDKAKIELSEYVGEITRLGKIDFLTPIAARSNVVEFTG